MATVNNIFEGQPVGNTVVDVSEFIELVCSYRCKLCGAVFDTSSSAAAKHVVTTHLQSYSSFASSATNVICPSKPMVEPGTSLSLNTTNFTVPLPFTADSVFHQEVTTSQLSSMPSVEAEERLSQSILAALPGQNIAVSNTMGSTFVGNTLFPTTVDSHQDGSSSTCDVSVPNAPRQMRVLINGYEVWLSAPNETPVQTNGSEKTHPLGPDTAETSVMLSDVGTRPAVKTGLNRGGAANSSESHNVVEPLPHTNAQLFASKLGTDAFIVNGSHTSEKTSGDLNSRECFLCSKCRTTFVTLDDCKEHMIQQHPELLGSVQQTLPDVSMPPNTISIGTQAQMYKKPGRKRKIVPSGEVIHLDADAANTESPVILEVPAVKKDELEACSAAVNAVNMLGIARADSDANGLSKRRVRAPKALVEDYYISRRKHKKRQNLSEAFNLGCSVKGCAAKFLNPESLGYHVKCHADVDDGDTSSASVVCPECKNCFATWKILRMHLWKIHGVDCDLFRCQADAAAEATCQFRTDTVQKLELHRETHNGAKTFGCQSCRKGFKNRNQLRSHELLHQDAEGRRSSACGSSKECHVCKRVFANQKSLKKHIEIVHNKRRPYLCNTCGHETSRKAMLDLHLRTHTGEKPYRCDMCNYTASDHNTLRRHRMRHTGEKPYKCQYCTYSCIQAISLKTHLKNKHPGCEGIYSCDVCQYHTVNKSHWLNHLEDHKNNLIAIDDPPGLIPVGTRDAINGKSSQVVCVDRETQNMEMSADVALQLRPLVSSETSARPSGDDIGQVPNSGVEMVELKGVTVLQAQEPDASLFGDGKTTGGQQIFQIANESDEYYVILNDQGHAVMHRIEAASSSSSYQPETAAPVVTSLFLQQSSLDASATGQLSNELEPSGSMVYLSTSNDQRDIGLQHILTAIHAQQQQTMDTAAVLKDDQEDES